MERRDDAPPLRPADFVLAHFRDLPLDGGAPPRDVQGRPISSADACVAGGGDVRGAPRTTRNGLRQGALHWMHFGFDCCTFSNMRQVQRAATSGT